MFTLLQLVHLLIVKLFPSFTLSVSHFQVKQLAQMFAAATQEAAVKQPKEKPEEERKLPQLVVALTETAALSCYAKSSDYIIISWILECLISFRKSLCCRSF